MKSQNSDGLLYDDKGTATKVAGFSAKCEKCASPDVTIGYTFIHYGGLTGWDQSLWIKCRSCGERDDLVI